MQSELSIESPMMESVVTLTMFTSMTLTVLGLLESKEQEFLERMQIVFGEQI
jgi:hypothetical protein